MFGFSALMLYGMRMVSGVDGAVVMSTAPAVTAASEQRDQADQQPVAPPELPDLRPLPGDGDGTRAPSATRSSAPMKTGIAPVTILLTGVAEPNVAIPSASWA